MSFLCANSISEFDEKFFLLMKYFGVIDLLTSLRSEQICNLNIFSKRKFIGSLGSQGKKLSIIVCFVLSNV